MKLANVEGRACIISDDGGIDLAAGSSGMFSSLVDDAIPVLDEVRAWFDEANPALDPALSTTVLQDALERLANELMVDINLGH